eukprot:5946925-Lingulodinium_polyedra.AAC.1
MLGTKLLELGCHAWEEWMDFANEHPVYSAKHFDRTGCPAYWDEAFKHLSREPEGSEAFDIIQCFKKKFMESDGRYEAAAWIQSHWQLRDNQLKHLASMDEPAKLDSSTM